MEESKVIRQIGRILIEEFEGFQELRKAGMSRIRMLAYRIDKDIDLDIPQGKKEDEEKAMGKEYNDKIILKKIEELKDKLNDEELIMLRNILVTTITLKDYENSCKPLMDAYLTKEPIWVEFLEHIKGISTVLGANLLKWLGYCDQRDENGEDRCPHVSSLWRWCGLDVVNGKAPKRKTGEKIHYNPKLRVLCWKIADSFVKQRTHPYRDIYDKEKEVQNRREYDKGYLLNKYGGSYEHDDIHITKGHAENRARRKMVKIFLERYWIKARTLKNLPISKPYVISKLGHKHYVELDESPPPAHCDEPPCL